MRLIWARSLWISCIACRVSEKISLGCFAEKDEPRASHLGPHEIGFTERIATAVKFVGTDDAQHLEHIARALAECSIALRNAKGVSLLCERK